MRSTAISLVLVGAAFALSPVGQAQARRLNPPANNPEDMAQLTAQGFSVFTMQRDQAAFDAIAAGRRASGRPVPTTN